jgi:hypothetical protein
VHAYATGSEHWGRESVAVFSEEYNDARSTGASERLAAASTGVPRSTLRGWAERSTRIDAPTKTKAFFESAEGVAFLHRLVTALHLVIVFNVGGGIRQVIQLLELVGLTGFVAASVGHHQGVAEQVQQALIAYGKQERARLGTAMTPKQVTLCEDETFHPETCLVAIEPVSNFIVAEVYVQRRDQKTWDATIKAALDGLPVLVEQSTSDEGKAILSHTHALGAQHAPDVFHVQHETSKAVSLGLARCVNAASEAVDKAKTEHQQVEQRRREWQETKHGPGRPPNFARQEACAQETLATANCKLDAARTRQEAARTARRGLSQDYHPVDLKTGEPRSVECVTELLEGHFNLLNEIAVQAQLPERSLAGLAKAARPLRALTASLEFFHTRVQSHLSNLGITAEQACIVNDYLLPAAYLERAANRARLADDKDALRQTAHERRCAGLSALGDNPIEPSARDRLLNAAAHCADLFQRTSSCVEGRNGQLSLRHHHLHHISPERLEALTVMHNYFIRRPDGTTAAQRFFGNRPADLFAHLLASIDLPARPARRPEGAARTPIATLH